MTQETYSTFKAGHHDYTLAIQVLSLL